MSFFLGWTKELGKDGGMSEKNLQTNPSESGRAPPGPPAASANLSVFATTLKALHSAASAVIAMKHIFLPCRISVSK